MYRLDGISDHCACALLQLDLRNSVSVSVSVSLHSKTQCYFLPLYARSQHVLDVQEDVTRPETTRPAAFLITVNLHRAYSHLHGWCGTCSFAT